MTRYAYEQARQTLVASWGTGVGDIGATVAELPTAVTSDQALHLAGALSRLSEAVWHTYTHPASAVGPDDQQERQRRAASRKAFGLIPAALADPNLPHDGMIIESYDPVAKTAHRAGRSLHAVGDKRLGEQVAADIAAELTAVESAERGDLSGRAAQAVLLTHADASPVQVLAADQLLQEGPLDNERLLTDLDPTASAVAAAHWLFAAATVVSYASGIPVTGVVAEADNIEAIPTRTPNLMLKRLDAGETPREVVTDLVAEAMAVAEGRIPDLDALRAQIQEADAQARGHGGAELRDALMPDRLTPLDPRRPAVDLLKDLLLGLTGCKLLYFEYADGDELDDEDELEDRLTQRFLTVVRAEATAHRDRLL